MAQPQPEGVPERIRAFLGADADGLPEPLDERNARHVDKAAEQLIKRFYSANDPAAFELLVALTLPLLNGAAEDVAREVGVAAGGRTLLTGIFSNLFTSIRRPTGLQDAAFLQWCVGQIREVAAAHATRLAARRIPVAETADTEVEEPASRRAQSAHGGGILGRLAMALASPPQAGLDSVGLSMSTVVEIVFHRLDLEHRRVLRCVEVARMSDEAAATFLQLPVDEIQERNAKARGALQAGVHAALEAISDKLSCALDGDAAKSMNAEHLAAHLVTCESCSSTADLMQSLGDVGGWLASVHENPGQPTLVEQVLAGVNARGKDELARVLYEMHRACLAMLGNRDTHVDLVEPPDPVGELIRSASAMTARGAANIPSLKDGEPNPLAASSRCVELLTLVEGVDGVRSRWARAEFCHASGEFARAVDLFSELVDDASVAEEMRSAARVNIMWGLLKEHRFDDVLALAKAMHGRGEQPKWAAMYLVWVAGWIRDEELFREGGRLLREANPGSASEDWWATLIQSELDWIAERLGLTIEDVRSTLGGLD